MCEEYREDIFFFKQKTAYELRISDWSSDVCASDLSEARFGEGRPDTGRQGVLQRRGGTRRAVAAAARQAFLRPGGQPGPPIARRPRVLPVPGFPAPVPPAPNLLAAVASPAASRPSRPDAGDNGPGA